jgi:hypothetical protein
VKRGKDKQRKKDLFFLHYCLVFSEIMGDSIRPVREAPIKFRARFFSGGAILMEGKKDGGEGGRKTPSSLSPTSLPLSSWLPLF